MQQDDLPLRSLFPLKSLAGALLFSVFLGPIGLLYASSTGGIIMIIVGFIAVCSQLFVPIIMVWVLSCIWSVLAVNRYNKKIQHAIRNLNEKNYKT